MSILDHDIKIAEKRRKMASILTGNRNALPSNESYNPGLYNPPIPASYGNGPVQTMQERQAIIANMQPVAANHPSNDPKSQYYSPPIPANGYDNKNRPK